MKKYIFSFMVSKLKIDGSWVLYNWLNTTNVRIEDKEHPLFKALNNNLVGILPFTVNGLTNDFDYLVSNYFLVQFSH